MDGIGLSMAMMLIACSAGTDDIEATDWTKMAPITPKQMACYRAAAEPVIDGKLDDPAWKSVPFSDDFLDIEGERKPKPRFRTRMKLLWDDRNFYVGADLEEPNVWGTIVQRDAVIFMDNDFEIFIDPDGDNHRYFEFEINALGTGWDLFLKLPYRNGGKANTEWNIEGLRTAVAIRGTLNRPADRDDGWSLELAIPWSALRADAGCRTPPLAGDRWRFNASRVEWQVNIVDGKSVKVANTKEDNWVWSPQGVVDMHRPERWGVVEFVAAQEPPVRLTADPSLPVRDALLSIYYRAYAHRQRHGAWPRRMDPLGLPPAAAKVVIGPQFEATPQGFRATARLILPDGSAQQWQIDELSRIRVVPTSSAAPVP